MEAISFISGWITWLLLIVPIAASCIITYFAVRKSFTTEESAVGEYNSKIKTTIIGAIICVTISGLITVIKSFYT